MSSVVDVHELCNGDDKFNNSKLAERWVLELVGEMKGWTDISLTDGYNPMHDATINDDKGTPLKVEVKFSSSPYIFVEAARADGTPSGIETSTADYYVCVNPGKSYHNHRWVEAGKVRVIPRPILYDLVHDILVDDPSRLVVYAASEHGPGSKGVYVDPKHLIDDGWIASVEMERRETADGKTSALYSLDRVIQKARH